MSVWRDAVTALTAEWAGALEDTCTIVEAAAGAYNPVTKTYGGTPTQVYSGACLVRPRGAASPQYGQQQVEVVDYDLYLPPTTTGIAPDQLVTINTTGTASPALAGQQLVVYEVEADTFNARLRVGCKLDLGP